MAWHLDVSEQDPEIIVVDEDNCNPIRTKLLGQADIKFVRLTSSCVDHGAYPTTPWQGSVPRRVASPATDDRRRHSPARKDEKTETEIDGDLYSRRASDSDAVRVSGRFPVDERGVAKRRHRESYGHCVSWIQDYRS